MKDKEFKDMTLNELLESDLSLEDIDEVIEEQLESEKQKGKICTIEKEQKKL